MIDQQDSNISSGFVTGPVRVEKSLPDRYRLARKPSGELVLQGAFVWQQGREGGYEWRDIPTVESN